MSPGRSFFVTSSLSGRADFQAKAMTQALDERTTELVAVMGNATRDLTTVLPRAKVAAAVPVDEVLARVREAANFDGGMAPKPTLLTDAMPLTDDRGR